MDHALAATEPRALGLNATSAAYRLYRSLGFSDEATVFQHNGRALAPGLVQLPRGAVLREAAESDLEAMAALDAQAFGTDRSWLLGHLFAASAGTVLLRGELIEAFALCRQFGRGHVIGPIVASCDADAIAVTRPHVAQHVGTFLRIDTRQQDGDFAAFLTQCGLPVYDTLTTMSFRRPWLGRIASSAATTPMTYALASHALS